jgi:hypothetical protein
MNFFLLPFSLVISLCFNIQISQEYKSVINELTLWSSVLLEELTVTQLVKKFPAFYGTRRSITVFTVAPSPSTVPNPERDESSYTHPPYFSKIYFNIIVLSKPRSSEWSSHFRFLLKILYAFLLSCYIPQPCHPP